MERFDRSDATEIANLATAYFSSRRCRKYTPAREQEVRGYLRSASEWLASRGCQTTTDVTEELAHEYAEYLLSTGLSVNTACRYTATLSAVWVVLTGADRVWKGQLHRSTEAAVGHRALTPEELEKIMSKADEAGPEWGLLFRVGMNTGLRLCDASTLTWEETDLDGRVLNVEPNKTRRYGTRVRIPMTDALAAEFTKLEGPRTGFILPCVATLYLKDRRRVCEKVQSIIQSAGIETAAKVHGSAVPRVARCAVAVGFHSLRHSFVTRCANAGVPLAVVGGIVGHRSERMTQVYSHQNEEGLAKVRAAMSKPCTECEPLTTPEADELVRRNAELAKGLSKSGRAKATRILNGYDF